MFTYICLGTNDLARAAVFYDAALATLGLRRCDSSGEPEWSGWLGWGRYTEHGLDELALWVGTPFDGRPATAGNGTMVALGARSWRAVDAFHVAALAAGGSCDGVPGIRPHYNPDFYVCYVRDPDGNKLAVVCRGFTQRDGQPD